MKQLTLIYKNNLMKTIVMIGDDSDENNNGDKNQFDADRKQFGPPRHCIAHPSRRPTLRSAIAERKKRENVDMFKRRN